MENMKTMERLLDITVLLLSIAGIGSISTLIALWFKHGFSKAVKSLVLVFLVFANVLLPVFGLLSCGHGHCTEVSYGILVASCIVSIVIIGFTISHGKKSAMGAISLAIVISFSTFFLFKELIFQRVAMGGYTWLWSSTQRESVSFHAASLEEKIKLSSVILIAEYKTTK